MPLFSIHVFLPRSKKEISRGNSDRYHDQSKTPASIIRVLPQTRQQLSHFVSKKKFSVAIMPQASANTEDTTQHL